MAEWPLKRALADLVEEGYGVAPRTLGALIGAEIRAAGIGRVAMDDSWSLDEFQAGVIGELTATEGDEE